MRGVRAVLLVVVLALPGMVTGHGAEEPEQITVAGEIVDLHCYLREPEARGPDHAGCAVRCLEQGQPMGLLTDDGTLYVLSAHHVDGVAFDAAKRLAGAMTEVTGVPVERNGMNGLELHRVGRRQ